MNQQVTIPPFLNTGERSFHEDTRQLYVPAVNPITVCLPVKVRESEFALLNM